MHQQLRQHLGISVGFIFMHVSIYSTLYKTKFFHLLLLNQSL